MNPYFSQELNFAFVKGRGTRRLPSLIYDSNTDLPFMLSANCEYNVSD